MPSTGTVTCRKVRRRGAALISLAVLVAVSGWLPSLPAQAQVAGFRRIAVAGQSAPGGGTFDRFDVERQPVAAPVNASGQVAFFARLARSGAEEGIFLHTGREVVKVAAQGDAIPGGGVLSGFANHPQIALNRGGVVVFSAPVAEAGATEGLFRWHEGRLDTIALAGAKAPGILSGTFSEFDFPALTDSGGGIFLATVRRGRETLEGIFRFQDGRIDKVVAAGDPAPGGGVYSGFGIPTLNNRGAVVFAALVDQGPVLGGLFKYDEGGGAAMVVAAGDAAPGGGIFYKFSDRVGVDDAGRVVVVALLKDAPSSAAIVLIEPGGRRILTSLGAAAPGGGTLSSFGASAAVSPGGAVAFLAGLDGGPNPIAILLWDGRGLRRVVGQGDRLGAEEVLAAFPPNTTVAISPTGGVTFPTLGREGQGVTGIAYVGP